MKGELFLFLISLLALPKTSSAQAPTERSNEPIFKLTQTDTRLGAIVRQIDELERQNRTRHRDLAAFTIGSDGYVDYSIQYRSDIDEVYRTIGWIEHLYEYLGKFEQARFATETQIEFAHSRLTDEVKEVTMETLHSLLFGSENPVFAGNNLLRFIAEGYGKYPNRTCRTPKSPQQYLYYLYVEYSLTELKQLAMLEWSWLFLEQFGRSEFSELKGIVRGNFQHRMNRTQKLIKDRMIEADRTIWRCDPLEPKAGVTYDEVTRLLQGYIENEVNLNAEGTCRHDCAYYQSARSEGCQGGELSSKQPRCAGRLHNCRFVESDMQVCQSDKFSHRRYEFIQGEDGSHLGRALRCSRQMDKAISWHSWFFKCSYCLCLCDEEGPQSDRYFNLRPVTSDIGRNRVVTGLRFVKHNRIFHLQIQEGELLPHGVINESTLQWKPLDTYSISDKDVSRGVDFHMLSYENRSIDLVEVKADPNFVVTGLRFRVLEGHLNLEAQFHEFDFKSGQLIEPSKSTYWLSAGDEKPRYKLDLENTQVSSETTTSSEPYPSHNSQYVDFTNSGLEQDAAQTTVPLIDIQEVVSKPPVPLSGIGVYYKGSKGNGGYLAPKLITYDYWPHVELPTV